MIDCNTCANYTPRPVNDTERGALEEYLAYIDDSVSGLMQNQAIAEYRDAIAHLFRMLDERTQYRLLSEEARDQYHRNVQRVRDANKHPF